MVKKGKNAKTKGKEKKSKQTLDKKYLIDPELLKDLDLKDVFRFWNGDVYLGQFELTAQGEIHRQGRGKYFTADGCSLIGQWDHDVLVDAERLSYPGSVWYRGGLEDGKYRGAGVYGHPELGTLHCNFHLGRPEGLVTLDDIDEHRWQGLVESNCLTLLPRNHFFDTQEALLIERRNDAAKSHSASYTKKSVSSKTSDRRKSQMTNGDK